MVHFPEFQPDGTWAARPVFTERIPHTADFTNEGAELDLYETDKETELVMSTKWLQSSLEGLGRLAELLISIVMGSLAGFGLLPWVLLFLMNPSNPLLGSTTSIALAPAVAIFGVSGWMGGTSLKSFPLSEPNCAGSGSHTR